MRLNVLLILICGFFSGVYLQLYGEGRCKFFSGAGKIKLVINNYEKYLDEKIVCFEGIGGS